MACAVRHTQGVGKRTGLSGLLLGSVSTRVLALVDQPVTLIK
jgi:nucleotide-binding universal stress UspA family protein